MAATGTDFEVGALAQVALFADDLDAAVAFYRDTLGLKLLARFEPPGIAFLDLAGVRLMLAATASKSALYLTVDDIEARVGQLTSRGVTFLQAPAMVHRDEAGDFGAKGMEEWMAFLNDPAGNLLALVERR